MSLLPFFSIFLFLVFILEAAAAAAVHSCLKSEISCPPFASFPPFPFSSSPGCGHPSFQIQCSPSHAVISINNLSFSLLHYESTSSTLLLSPASLSQNEISSVSTEFKNCSLHHRSISLSGSPFKVSDSSCSRLSALRPCPPTNLPNCSHCPWQCKLIKNPLQLLHECGLRHHFESDERCQSDILGFLDEFLKMGIEVEWDEEQDSYFSSCRTCRASSGVCGFNSSHPKKPFLCFPSSQVRYSPPLIGQKSANRVVMLSMVFLFVCFLVVFSIGSLIFRSRGKGAGSEEDPTIIYLRRHRLASLLPPVFPYEELESSTNHFDHKRKLGDGGFGSVYLGNLDDGRLVAVKHLHKHSPSGTKAFSTKSFCNEILILSSINHPNLVKLHGYCSDPRGLLLVYDYVPNGTLADHLHGNKNLYKRGSLTWTLRVDIALQIAMAIEYLHFSVVPPIVHRDITSTNIFVEKDMRVKVGDFGLSRLLVCTDTSVASGDSTSEVWTGPQGTPGYLDPDYHKSFRLNEKSDIYSFGVVLLELITGMKAVDQKREKREMALADMVVSRIQMGLLQQVVDPFLVVDGEAMEGVGAVAELAFRCVAADKDDRPDSRDVVAELRRIRGRTRGVGSGGILRTSNSSNMVVPDGIGLID
ncbi:LEAF RUST 10 DISEASE-RESISTANCE LOCUS RECEPTOR-LIKE PROTEIN KINASE-like 1.5 [Solanum verrucosum]|uniref:LEAF RUST 10 DISEASE-RESISTANCE LOCUS RECEPTOR-LIKE PROTEIN KINASE-like 1.5 n=1 Tax=Solanum verrucosum TaxID=315347 RepID=UPI0020D01A02|nr:LEAF RUST 10 DISEASE-RESISTANCE LOCUS RECEPTOR-LIKE PROTEIN KINASE-like 1.5 [Solanum verrucosum]